MKMEPGTLVKALYKFDSNIKGELSFEVNDVIQIIDIVDKYWLNGTKGNESGNFPKSFVIEISWKSLPTLQADQHLFVASESFVGGQDGDLVFDRGDLIIGLAEIDVNWWHGKDTFGNKGIFPITHAWKVRPLSDVKKNAGEIKDLYAVVKFDMQAKLEDEIDLNVGETVRITEIIDKDWYRGECNGRVGIFPSHFVEITENSVTDEKAVESQVMIRRSSLSSYDPQQSTASNNFSLKESQNTDSNSNPSIVIIHEDDPSEENYGYDADNSGITPYGRALFSFNAQYPDELSFAEGDIITLHRYVDSQWMEGEVEGRVGLVPCDYIYIIVDCPIGTEHSFETIETDASNQSKLHSFSENSTASVLYDFYAQTEEDLTLVKDEYIQLLRQVDDEWYQAKNADGRIGLCPKDYVKIINDSSPVLTINRNSVHAISSVSCPSQNKQSSQKAMTMGFDGGIFNVDKLGNDESQNCASTFKRSVSINDKYLTESVVPPIPSLTKDSEPSSQKNVADKMQETKLKDFHPQNLDTNEDFSLLSNINQRQSAPGDVNRKQPSNEINLNFSSPMLTSQNIQYSKNASFPSNINDKKPLRPAPPAPLSSYQNNAKVKPGNGSAKKDAIKILKSKIKRAECNINELNEQKLELELEIDMKFKLNETDETDFPDKINVKLNACKSKLSEMAQQLEKYKTQLKEALDGKKENRAGEKPPSLNTADITKCDDSVKRDEMIVQRRKVIVELFESEGSYIKRLKICHDVFLKNRQATQDVGIDLELLFGNLDEVIATADKLLGKLQYSVKNRPEEKQVIGECFCEIAEDLKEAYGHYCRNHDEVIVALEKYKEIPEIQAYINKGVDKIRKKINCFNLDAILITPVQRILKYPLLLNELHRCTADSHPDKKELLEAIALMSDVATAINEFKRRHDLVFKYKKDAHSSFSAKLSKLNLHSVKKKSARMSMKLSSSIGIYSVTKDETFDEYEQKFRILEKTAKTFLKDVHVFCDHLQQCLLMQMTVAESIADYYIENVDSIEFKTFRIANRDITNRYLQDFKSFIDSKVCFPLSNLLKLFSGPNNLIQKRNDKLLDYDNCSSKLNKSKDANKKKQLNEEEQAAKNNYEALNCQLLDELPSFLEISRSLLQSCLTAYIFARKRFIGRIARRIFPLMELPLLVSSQGDILQSFNIKHNVVIAKVNDINLSNRTLQSSSLSLPRPKKEKSPKSTTQSRRSSLAQTSKESSLQTNNQKVHVLSTYSPKDTYVVKSQYVSSDVLDISVNAGGVVGVIMRKDPMGSDRRWFVDNGAIKGFILSSCLQPYSNQNFESLPSYDEVASSSSSQAQLMTLSPTHTTSSRQKPSNLSFLQDFDPLVSPNVEERSSDVDINRDPFSPSQETSSLNSHFYPERNDNSNSNQVLEPQHNVAFNQSVEGICQNVQNSNQNISSSHSTSVYPNRSSNVSISPTSNLQQHSQFYSNTSNSQGDRYDVVTYDEASANNRYEEISDSTSLKYEEVTDVSDNRYEEIPDVSYECVKEDKTTPQYYFALFPYNASRPNILSLAQGQVVLVYQKTDSEGNSDWWFVEDRYGNQGYVPGSYLTPYENS